MGCLQNTCEVLYLASVVAAPPEAALRPRAAPPTAAPWLLS